MRLERRRRVRGREGGGGRIDGAVGARRTSSDHVGPLATASLTARLREGGLAGEGGFELDGFSVPTGLEGGRVTLGSRRPRSQACPAAS